MKKRHFAVPLALLATSALPMFGQRKVSVRASLALLIEYNVTYGYWSLNYGGSFSKPGTNWQLEVGGGEPDSTFTLCATKDEQRQSCTPNFGHTDQNGTWQLAGTFDASSSGNWTEWIQFPDGAISNRISFGIGTVNPVAQLQINGATAGVLHVHQPWTLSVSHALRDNDQFDLCSEAGGVSVGCLPNFGRTDGNGSWTLTGTFPSEVIGGWSEWVRFRDGSTTNRISFTIDDSPLDDLTCASGTIYPIGPNASYGAFPRYMFDWYPSDPGDYRLSPGHPGGIGNTLEYFGCKGGEFVWLQWAYTSFFGYEVRAPWGGQTDRGLRIGDSLVRFKSLYPAAQRFVGETSNATADAWDIGPLRVFIQNGAVAGIRVNWAIPEYSPDNKVGALIAGDGPTNWFGYFGYNY